MSAAEAYDLAALKSKGKSCQTNFGAGVSCVSITMLLKPCYLSTWVPLTATTRNHLHAMPTHSHRALHGCAGHHGWREH